MIHLPEILSVLESAPLFRDISGKTLAYYLEQSRLRELEQDETLLVAGQVNDLVYIVLSGRLRIQLQEMSDEPIAMLGEGECVGEMSVLGENRASAYVIAATACKLLVIDKDALLGLIENSHEAAHNMLGILTRRISLANQLMAENLEKQNGYAGISIVDEMTGLYNYHWTLEKFGRHLQRSILNDKPSCLLMLEMDSFERFNHDYGQLGGEQALRDIANVMLTCLRPDDQAGHYLDKRFVVFLPNTALADASIAAERLQKTIGKTMVVLPSGDALPAITVSLGISQARVGDTLEALCARADEALELAKKTGGNRIETLV